MSISMNKSPLLAKVNSLVEVPMSPESLGAMLGSGRYDRLEDVEAQAEAIAYDWGATRFVD
jgi:hypothetical protein